MQAEDGIEDTNRNRGRGDGNKKQERDKEREERNIAPWQKPYKVTFWASKSYCSTA